jgi:energy-coupling factor transport system permease protein
MNAATLLGDAQGRAWLARLDPRLKIAVIGWCSLLTILLESTSALLAMLLASILLAASLRMSWQGWLAVVSILALVAWSTMLSQAMFFEPGPGGWVWQLVPPRQIGPWSFPGLRLSEQGAWHGLVQSLRMLSVTLVGLTVCLSTSPERLLSAMARLHVPVSVSFLTVTTLRFLPLLLSQWLSVRQARRLRGYRLRWWHLATPQAPRVIASELSLLTPLLASAVRRAAALATSVSSRGFDPTARRTFYPELRFRPPELTILAILGITLVALIIAKALYWLHTADWHHNHRLQPFYDFVQRWL